MALAHPFSEQLDRLTAFDAGPFPVVSLYLNLQPDDRGRDRFDTFVRGELTARINTFPAEGPERASLEQDQRQIEEYLTNVDPAANGLALFSCSAAGLFEAIQTAAPFDAHHLSVAPQPHLYPLARVLDEYPRYAVLVADTHVARVFVVAANAVQRAEAVESVKTKRHKVGGMSQARYQRHVDNFRQQHAKEAVDVLTRLVRGEQIPSVLLAGDDVIVSLLRNELPKDIAERVVDVLRLEARAPEHEILETSLEALHRNDAESDRERVERLVEAYRGSGLGVIGIDAVRRALEMGQVQELVITAVPDAIKAPPPVSTDAAADKRSPQERIADELIVQANQTSASIRFIEDADLLKPFGGVGAFLPFAI